MPASNTARLASCSARHTVCSAPCPGLAMWAAIAGEGPCPANSTAQRKQDGMDQDCPSSAVQAVSSAALSGGRPCLAGVPCACGLPPRLGAAAEGQAAISSPGALPVARSGYRAARVSRAQYIGQRRTAQGLTPPVADQHLSPRACSRAPEPKHSRRGAIPSGAVSPRGAGIRRLAQGSNAAMDSRVNRRQVRQRRCGKALGIGARPISPPTLGGA